MSLTITETYTAIHKAFDKYGRGLEIRPFAMRVLLAISDANDSYPEIATTTDRLEELLGSEAERGPHRGADIRRALGELYAAKLVAGVSAVDGGRRRAGHRTLVTLTADGKKVLHMLEDELNGILG
jgi:hypothetical protein